MLGFPLDSRVTYVTNPDTGVITPQYDRAVTSKPLREYIRGIVTTGVLPNPSDNLQVFPGTDGMTVIVHAGFAVIDGGLAKEDNNRTLEVTASDATYDRIDTVVVRWNDNDSVRNVDLYIKQGVPARNPVRPTLTREGSVYEIGLADIFVTKNVRTITAEKITDTRLESARCGVASSIAKWDTTTIYQQIQSDLAGFKSNEQAEFMTWFERMKDQLTEDAAGKLQTEVDDIKRQIHTVDTTLSTTSTNPVQNKAIAEGINSIQEKIATEAETRSKADAELKESVTNQQKSIDSLGERITGTTPESYGVVDAGLTMSGQAGDAYVIGTKFDDIYSNIELVQSKQLLNPFLSKTGGYGNNDESLGDTYRHVVIRALPNTKYTIFTYGFCNTYNGNELLSSTVFQNEKKTIITPKNCNKIILSYGITVEKDSYIVIGESEPSSLAWKEPTIRVKNKLYERNNIVPLYDTEKALKNVGLYEYNNGIYNNTLENYRYYTFDVENDEEYIVSTFSHIAFFNNDRYLSGVLNSNTTPIVIKTPVNANKCIVSTTLDNIPNMFINKGKDIVKHKSIYTLPYIKDCKVLSNEVTPTLTAYYAGIDAGDKVKKFTTSFIFEKQKIYTSVVAMILHGKTLHKISGITQKSLHLVITPSSIDLSILGQDWGEYYYAHLIETALNTPLNVDGVTENTVTLSVDGNNVSVTVNSDTYNGKFIDDKHNLDEVVGNYATFEHYYGHPKALTSTPMFTSMVIDTENGSKVYDYFEREDGILTTTPTGHNYVLLSNDDRYSGN